MEKFQLLKVSIKCVCHTKSQNDCCYSIGLDVYSVCKSSSIANKLTVVTGNDTEEVFKCYVHDFVMYSCGSSKYDENAKV